MKTKMMFVLSIACSIMMVNLSCTKKDPAPAITSTTTTYSGTPQAVVITTGAQTLKLGEKVTLSANFVDALGNTISASNITWTSSNTELVTIEGNKATAKSEGQVIITAKATVDGKTVESSIIFGIASRTQSTLFTVAPEALIWTTNAGTIPMYPVYLGSGTPNFTYTSSDPSIITVSSSGEITFLKAGQAFIKVEASGLTGKPTVNVPVLVLGTITTTSPLLVSRVSVTPSSTIMFKRQTAQLEAKAHNSAGTLVSGEVASWAIENDTNNFAKNAVSIDQNGKITANSEGSAIAYATIKGIRAQASIEVYPDSVLIITPYYITLDKSATKQFTATLYKVNRSTKLIESTPLTTPTNIKWEIPAFGAIDASLAQFDVATVSNSGLVSMKADAISGFATALEAHIPGTRVGGAALLMVSTPGVPNIDSGGGNTTTSGGNTTFTGIDPNGM